ncbi:MAG: LysM peptidoglycan-binding domain-containing protein [Bacteroidota bacterium]|nr:LysM peptidoglycan-binding domain-containing protein [Bacteroidota bacterium]
MKKEIYIFIIFVFCLFGNFSYSQETQTKITKSTKIEWVNGKKYYLHTVEKGQYLSMIAKAYGVKLDDLKAANPDIDEKLHIDQVLRVPAIKENESKNEDKQESKTDKYVLHKVEKGETLYAIKKKYGVSVDDIMFINPELVDGLKVGQTIKIPNVTKEADKIQAKENTPKTSKAISEVKKKETKVTDTGINKEVVTETKKTESKIKTKVKAEDSNEESEVSAEKHNAKATCEIPRLLNSYNIALMIPLYLDDIDSNNFSSKSERKNIETSKSFTYLGFYEGAMIAVDSLKKQGITAKIHVYDVNEDTTELRKILKKPEMSKMNLIIGPFHSKSFNQVSKYAKSHKINIVSPVTSENISVEGNSNIFKTVPSTKTQLDEVAEYIANNYKSDNIILVHNNNEKEKKMVREFKTKIHNLKAQKGYNLSLLEYSYNLKGINGLANELSVSKENIIVTFVSGEAFVGNYIRKLNDLSDKYKITLFGLPMWKNYENIDDTYINNLKLHLFSTSFVNYEDPDVNKFLKVYREKYKTEPDKYAFQGFDVTYLFLKALKEYGTTFDKCISNVKFNPTQTLYRFDSNQNSGYENAYVTIFKHEGYKYVPVNR